MNYRKNMFRVCQKTFPIDDSFLVPITYVHVVPKIRECLHFSGNRVFYFRRNGSRFQERRYVISSLVWPTGVVYRFLLVEVTHDIDSISFMCLRQNETCKTNVLLCLILRLCFLSRNKNSNTAIRRPLYLKVGRQYINPLTPSALWVGQMQPCNPDQTPRNDASDQGLQFLLTECLSKFE